MFPPSCLSCVRSEELHTLWLSFVFPALDFTLSLSVFLCLSSLSSFFLILACSFPFTHCSTRCLLWNVNFPPSFKLSMKLWEEDTEHVGGLVFLSPLISLLHKYLSTGLRLCLFLSRYCYHCLSSCLFFWSSLSLFCPLLCLSLSLPTPLSAVLMKGWLM